MTEQELELSRQYLNMVHPKIYTSAVINRKMKAGLHDVDVIVPCFNAEEYLEKCLNSVLDNESKFDIHVIAVDDGSTDSTGKILDDYADDKRVLVIHQDNKGLSGARNTGLNAADAKYLFFLDSDDFLFGNSLDYLLEQAKEKDADILEGGIVNFEVEINIVSKASRQARIDESDSTDISGFACGKLIRTRLFDDICFPEGYWFEDGIMAYLILPRTKRNFKSNMPVYAYRMNPEGISSRSQTSPKAIDAYWLREILFEDMQKLVIEIDQSMYEKLMDEIVMTYVRTNGLDTNVKVAIFYLTMQWFLPLHERFSSGNRFHSILEKGFQMEDFKTYCDGCAIVWNSKLG